MVEKLKKCGKKWNNRVERRFLKVCDPNRILRTALKAGYWTSEKEMGTYIPVVSETVRIQSLIW
jgi:hypothetical protein